jgi:glycosyltransferase involved in cell wall biosynthesis
MRDGRAPFSDSTVAGPAILQIVPSLDAGGAERTTIDVARALVKAGYTAIVASAGGRLQNELFNSGAELIPFPMAAKNPVTLWSNAARLAAIIRERNIVLVHARSRAPAWSGYLAARREHVPFITTYHGIYAAKGPLKRFYNSVMIKGEAVIANSEWTAAHIRSEYSTKPKRLVVIPRGIDLAYYDPATVTAERISALWQKWSLTGTERVVLLPGRLSRWKGQLVFVKALALLKSLGRWPANARAVIVGDAQGRLSYLREVAQAIHGEGLHDIVTLDGHVADMAAAYMAADIVVSASTDPEAFGRVAPEAAAMGRPVIATDHGGARETVLAGRSGLLTPPGNAMALAEALRDLLDRTPEELRTMGEAGRAHIGARYTVERMCAETLAVYKGLVGGKAEAKPRF